MRSKTLSRLKKFHCENGVMKAFKVDYLTEDPTKEYVTAIRATKSKEELVKVITPYKVFAEDALKQAKAMSIKDFLDFLPAWKRKIMKEAI